MNNKVVGLLLLSTLSGFNLSACSNDSADDNADNSADVKTQTAPAELTAQPTLAATDLKEDPLIPTVANTEDKSLTTSSNEGAKQAKIFQEIYTATCMEYVFKLDELRDNLKNEPKFPSEQASQLLPGDTAGSAWPVPADTGNYILAIPDDISLCAIYAKDLDTKLTNQQFIDIYSNPPAPFIAKQMSNTTEQRENGINTNVSYSWSAPDTPRKMLFMLTTDDSGSTNAKAMYTASIMSE